MEAEREIAKYRDQQEQIFEQEKEEIHEKIDGLQELNEQAEADIQQIEEEYNENKDEVIQYLLEVVKSVSLSVPKVVQGKFE